MKKYIINVLFLILPFLVIGQTVQERFSGFGNINSVTSLGSANYTIALTGFTGSPRFEVNGTWSGSDVSVGDVIFRDGARYVITLVNSSSAGGFNVRVNSPDEGLGVSALNNGDIVAIGDEFDNGIFPLPRQGDGAGSGVPPSLASSIEIHNSSIINTKLNQKLDTLYQPDGTLIVSGDTIQNIFNTRDSLLITNGGVKMDSANTQTLAIGYFPNFPSYTWSGIEGGLMLREGTSGDNYLAAGKTMISMYRNNGIELYPDVTTTGVLTYIPTRFEVDLITPSEILLGGATNSREAKMSLQNFKNNGTDANNMFFGINEQIGYFAIGKNTFDIGIKYYWQGGVFGDDLEIYGKYRLPNAQPSATNNLVSGMKWNGNGTTAVPVMDTIFNNNLPTYQDNDKGWFDNPLSKGIAVATAARSMAIDVNDFGIDIITTTDNYSSNYSAIYNAANQTSIETAGGGTSSSLNINTNNITYTAGTTAGNVLFPDSLFNTTGARMLWQSLRTPSEIESVMSVHDSGSTSGTTDGSGDITVTCVMRNAVYSANVTTTGTTFAHPQVHTKGSTSFKIRFYDAAGAALTATAVTADWQLIEN